MTPEQRTARIAELEAKLKAREGQPGFASNTEAIREQIEGLQNGFRESDTGQFISADEAINNPDSVEPV